MDDLDQCEIGQLIVASEELALRSATARHNMERASARLAALLDQIDAQHIAVMAILQAQMDGRSDDRFDEPCLAVEAPPYASCSLASTVVSPSLSGPW